MSNPFNNSRLQHNCPQLPPQIQYLIQLVSNKKDWFHSAKIIELLNPCYSPDEILANSPWQVDEFYAVLIAFKVFVVESGIDIYHGRQMRFDLFIVDVGIPPLGNNPLVKFPFKFMQNHPNWIYYISYAYLIFKSYT